MTEIERYRKKPVVIEAIQWDGTSDLAIEIASRIIVQGGDATYDSYENELSIVTPEGIMRVSPGDYVIRGFRGEFYPCKPHIFENTYEPEFPLVTLNPESQAHRKVVDTIIELKTLSEWMGGHRNWLLKNVEGSIENCVENLNRVIEMLEDPNWLSDEDLGI